MDPTSVRRMPNDQGAMKVIPILGQAVVSFLLTGSAQHALSATNGVGLTPPMGYNTWFAYGTNINDALIRAVADAMATNGLRQAGYEYICVDDGWAGYRDTDGFIVPNTNKFP